MLTGRQMADPMKGGGGQDCLSHLIVFAGLTVASDSAKEKQSNYYKQIWLEIMSIKLLVKSVVSEPAASSANMAFLTQTPIGGTQLPSTLSCAWTSQCSSSSHLTPCCNISKRTMKNVIGKRNSFRFNSFSYLANVDWRRISRYAAVRRTTFTVGHFWHADCRVHHRRRWTGLCDASQFRWSRAMAFFTRSFRIHQAFTYFQSHIAKFANWLCWCIDGVCTLKTNYR